jgi:hypothetical protein
MEYSCTGKPSYGNVIHETTFLLPSNWCCYMSLVKFAIDFSNGKTFIQQYSIGRDPSSIIPIIAIISVTIIVSINGNIFP